jgi:hypothetical protein
MRYCLLALEDIFGYERIEIEKQKILGSRIFKNTDNRGEKREQLAQ